MLASNGATSSSEPLGSTLMASVLLLLRLRVAIPTEVVIFSDIIRSMHRNPNGRLDDGVHLSELELEALLFL